MLDSLPLAKCWLKNCRTPEPGCIARRSHFAHSWIPEDHHRDLTRIL